ncbi:MAG: 3-phosphoshikimate 1-carboxyvinyltransferase, partial [Methylotenera sp.]|nr:3-phosphoshikimate 1-carboxyvinyltransferase [Methylotenera sp.]
MEQLTLPTASHAEGKITLPGSKSISNRTLLLAALADSGTVIHNLLASDDTARMLEALESLGVKPEKSSGGMVTKGCNGSFPQKGKVNSPVDLFLGNAGTAFRPLTAALAFSNGYFYLHGVPRMHERPIGDLVDALRQAGAQIEYLGHDGFPPLKISPAKLNLSKPIKIRGDVSSQFLTALLMALPLTKQQASIEVIGELISKPYIEITLKLMAKFGVNVIREGWQHFTIPANSQYKSPIMLTVEGDASSASYFLAAGAIACHKPVQIGLCVIGVDFNSIQGDVEFAKVLKSLGVPVISSSNMILVSAPNDKIKGFDLDCNNFPDAAMTLAILALFADGTTTLRNIASWRVKETDRIAAMATELRKVGAVVEEGADYIKITPPAQLTPN